MTQFSDKKYNIIYADPPWRYCFCQSKRRKIENQYQTMNTRDICSLRVPTQENAILYLWATAPKLTDALLVMGSWGFKYKTHLIWDKEIMGMGYWFRGQHELLLVGTKGTATPPMASERIRSVFRERRTIHSKKPNRIRDLISSWYPEAAKLELFARGKVEGWDAWGNEVDRFSANLSIRLDKEKVND